MPASAYNTNKTITVTYSVGASVAPATVSNTASASASGATTATGTVTVDITRSVALVVTLYCSGNHVDLHSFPTRRSSDLKNNGPSDATAVHLTDTVDNRLTVTAVSES